jgi:hypothetical protein
VIIASINGIALTYSDGEWLSKSETLVETAKLYEESYWVVDGSYVPDRELAIMQYVLEITGGRIIKHDPIPQTDEPGVVF